MYYTYKAGTHWVLIMQMCLLDEKKGLSGETLNSRWFLWMFTFQYKNSIPKATAKLREHTTKQITDVVVQCLSIPTQPNYLWDQQHSPC